LEDNYIRVTRLQEEIDKIDIDRVRVVTDDDDDIILIEQKLEGKAVIIEIEHIMDTVETQWNIQDFKWEMGLINAGDIEQKEDMYRKQLSELTKKDSILQEDRKN
jgi:hypothetical protein